MVPKVNKFDFYYYETIDGTIVQLVGQSADRFIPDFLSEKEIEEIQRRAQLCEILTRIEFTMNSYGLVNFFVEYYQDIEDLKKLMDLLQEYNDQKTIDRIKESFKFYEEHLPIIESMRSSPHYDDEYDKKYESLNKKIERDNILSDCTVLMDAEIRKNPNHFCFDEDGQPIDPLFTGTLKRFYPNGNIHMEYSFLNGRVHGEAMNYNFHGKKQRLDVYENGRRVET